MSRCSKCPALIVWARTVDGKSMPLDADDAGGLRTYPPDEGRANVAVRPNRDLRAAPVARVLRRDETPLRGEVRAMPHFATCSGWTRS